MSLTDLQDRTRGATEFDRNLVVVAGAGTGKTSLLVERLLNLLLTQTVSVEEIVVTTFTKKAAAELKDRVGEALGKMSQGSVEPDSEAQRSWDWLTAGCALKPSEIVDRARDLCLNLDRAPMSTLHSYAADILRRYPLEAGMAPDFTPDAGEERRLLVDELWPLFLDDELQEDGERIEAWQDILSQAQVTDIEAAAKALVKHPQALDHLVHRGYIPRSLEEEFADKGDAFIERLEPIASRLEKGTTKLQVDKQLEILRGIKSRGPDALQGVELHSRIEGSFWGGCYTGSLRKVEGRERIEETVQEVSKALDKWRKTTLLNMQSLTEILKTFGEYYRKRAGERGIPAMDDLLIGARALLAGHPEIRERESKRTKAFLVDEFQDTDPIQYEILFLLSAARGLEREETPYHLPLVPGKLFIVGDPKQSIYRFRGADMESYDRAVRAIESQGGNLLHLTNNFRSMEPVIRATNALFEGYMGQDDDHRVEPAYDPLDCARKELTEASGVELWSVGSLGRYKNRTGEARVVAQAILDLRREGLEQKDIALLFRATTELPHYTRALTEAGVDFVVEGGKSFVERPEVLEGLSLLRTLANPADPVACVAAFRWTFGGVPDEELVRYSQAGGVFSWQYSDRTNRLLEDGSFPNIRRVVARLRELHQQSRSYSVDRFIHHVLLESELPLLQAAYFDAPQRLANVHKLAERCASIARERSLSLEQSLTVLEDNLRGEAQEWESPLADETVDAVRILTIHKAKGLEFPVVFVPDLPGARGGGDYRDPARFILGEIEGERRLGLIFNRKGDVPAQLLLDRENEHEAAESKRLLYVAMTRAKDKLIVVNSAKNPAWNSGFQQWGYDASAPEDGELKGGVLHRCMPVPEAVVSGTEAAGDLVVEPVMRLRKYTRKLREADPPRVFRTPSEGEHEEKAGSGAGLNPEDAKALGNVLHHLMEIHRQGDDLEKQLAQLVEDGSHSTRVKSEAKGIVSELAQSDLLEHLYHREILGREIPLLFIDDQGVVVHGFADLIYREKDSIIVADYKSDAYTGSAEEAAEAHRSQLADYAAAVQRAFDLEQLPQPEVIFLRTGVRVRLGYPPPQEIGQLGIDFS